jgi:hypothetical protein
VPAAAGISFDTTFGILLAKAWRLKKIFHNVKLRRKPIRTVELLAPIAGLVAFTMVYNAVWEVFGTLMLIKDAAICELTCSGPSMMLWALGFGFQKAILLVRSSFEKQIFTNGNGVRHAGTGVRRCLQLADSRGRQQARPCGQHCAVSRHTDA